MSPAPLNRSQLAALCDKYREMVRLRQLHAAGLADDPRAAMRALAERFPGALREIDVRTLADLEARLALLEAAHRGEQQAPAWAALQLSFHECMRSTLEMKRSAGVARDPMGARAAVATRALGASERDVDADVAENLDAALPAEEAAARAHAPPPREPAPLDESARDAVLRAPGGRLVPWVLARVAAAHGVTAAQVEDALFAGVRRGCVEK